MGMNNIRLSLVDVNDRQLDSYNKIWGLDFIQKWIVDKWAEEGNLGIELKHFEDGTVGYRPIDLDKFDAFVSTIRFNRSAWSLLVGQLKTDLSLYLKFEVLP